MKFLPRYGSIYNATQTRSRPTILSMTTIKITAPARLHLGFVGLEGQSAKTHGALGLAIDQPATVLEAHHHPKWKVSGIALNKAVKCMNTVRAALALRQPIHIKSIQSIPEHIGLGSGTQLALSVATACMQLNDHDVSPEMISGLLGRGARSGIGTAAFSKGGFLVDCQAEKTRYARAISKRIEFPDGWRIILIIDETYQGIHDQTEVNAFESLGGFSTKLSTDLKGVLLNQVVPALEDRDITAFGSGISLIQKQVGDFFKPVQGGRFLSQQVAEVLDYAERNGAAGIGQSSWGPTGFIIIDGAAAAFRMNSNLENLARGSRIRIEVCAPRNSGATIKLEHLDALAHQAMTGN